MIDWQSVRYDGYCSVKIMYVYKGRMGYAPSVGSKIIKNGYVRSWRREIH